MQVQQGKRTMRIIMLVWWAMLWQLKGTPWASLLIVKLHLFCISVMSFMFLYFWAYVVSCFHGMAHKMLFLHRKEILALVLVYSS